MQELKKKVILLRNFKNYMVTDALERKDFGFSSSNYAYTYNISIDT